MPQSSSYSRQRCWAFLLPHCPLWTKGHPGARMGYEYFQLSAPKAVPVAQVQPSEEVQVLAGGSKGTLEPGEGGARQQPRKGTRVSGQNINSIAYRKHLIKLV